MASVLMAAKRVAGEAVWQPLGEPGNALRMIYGSIHGSIDSLPVGQIRALNAIVALSPLEGNSCKHLRHRSSQMS